MRNGRRGGSYPVIDARTGDDAITSHGRGDDGGGGGGGGGIPSDGFRASGKGKEEEKYSHGRNPTSLSNGDEPFMIGEEMDEDEVDDDDISEEMEDDEEGARIPLRRIPNRHRSRDVESGVG